MRRPFWCWLRGHGQPRQSPVYGGTHTTVCDRCRPWYDAATRRWRGRR